MGKKKIYKEDKTEDFDAEKLEQDDPTLDDNGEPVEGSAKEDGSISSTDGVSEQKAADTASGSDFGDMPAFPAITDTADNSVKDQDGKVVDSDHAAHAPEDGPTDGVAAPEAADEGKDSPPEIAPLGEAALPTVAATETPSPQTGMEAGAGDTGETTKEEAPKDPATMPGMSPVNGVGEVESQIVSGPATTNIDSVSAGDKPPALGELSDAAKPVADTLDAALLDSFKDAGNKATEAIHGLKSFEAELGKLPAEAKAIVNQLRHMGAHFVSACERIFKRG